ncbi:MAG TPA: tRNA (guanosine(46)-N7)-methyltransferase TrmB [Anaerovoracaceae bacterium]|nr:tRNA (guanosine(46)-N7)-methyltransferase TrmB [Anaerovoracaceae bacterium]
MRQRKVKNEIKRLAALEHLQVNDPKKNRGSWMEFIKTKNHFPEDIFLEIGCGRGKFLADLAQANPNSFYLGAEGKGGIVLSAMEMVDARQLVNVQFILEYIIDIDSYFSKGEISGIYLNFSDPWPKVRHAKRRLTHRRFLRGFRHVLRADGFMEFRTDDENFFNFSLKEAETEELLIEELSRNLHESNLDARFITSQYEDKYRRLGKAIYYCKMRVKI